MPVRVDMAGSDARLTPTFFHLLLCLAEGPKHGYGMMLEIEERTAGALRPGPSSLYYALGRLVDAGLIEETEVAPSAEEMHGERRRYYELTGAGRRRLREEVSLLDQVMAHARARGLVGEGGESG
jgi:DNA-binding PadR family transcriptional regulator